MTAKLTTAATYVQINDTTFPKNKAKIKELSDGTVEVREIGGGLIASGPYTDWRNSSDTVYASKAALMTALQGALFV